MALLGGKFAGKHLQRHGRHQGLQQCRDSRQSDHDIGVAAYLVVVLFGIIGYFVGKYLDGEIDTDDIRARAQGRQNCM